MSQQLKLDIDRPAWHENNYKSEISDSWALSENSERKKEVNTERSVSSNIVEGVRSLQHAPE